MQLARTATVLRDSAIGTGSVVEDGALVRACMSQLQLVLNFLAQAGIVQASCPAKSGSGFCAGR